MALTDCAPEYGPQPLVQASTLAAGVPVEAVRGQLTSWFGTTVAEWRHLSTVEVPYALPAAEPPQGRLRAPVRVEPGLYVAGDHRDSPSIQGAMVSGRRAASAVLADRRVGSAA
jgi:predicted NAD/FAD-dependent oxidoreductase